MGTEECESYSKYAPDATADAGSIAGVMLHGFGNDVDQRNGDSSFFTGCR